MAHAPPSLAIGTRDIDSTPPAMHQVVEAGAHLLRGHVDRFQPGGAEPVDLDAAHGLGHRRRHHRGACNIGALVTDRAHDAEDEVGDPVLVQVRVAGAQLPDQAGDQIDRLDRVQRTGLLPAPARSPDRLVDERLCRHVDVPFLVRVLLLPAGTGGSAQRGVTRCSVNVVSATPAA